MSQSDFRTYYELVPLFSLDRWWQLAGWFFAMALLLAFVVWMYRRDTRSLARPMAMTLLALRITAVAGLVLFFLGPERRSEARVVKPSRVAVMIDTSLSMGLPDDPEGDIRRIDIVNQMLAGSRVLTQLNRKHDLVIYEFGETNQPEPILTSRRRSKVTENAAPPTSAEPNQSDVNSNASLVTSRRVGWVAITALGLSMILLLSSLTLPYLLASPERRAWTLALGGGLLVIGTFLLALADLISSEYPLPVSLGWRSPENESVTQQIRDGPTGESEESLDFSKTDWSDQLTPEGISTRLGTALQDVVDRNRGSALAGIVLITDGRDNQGTPPSQAIAAASNANIPVYPLGIGSDQPARNVQISEVQAPQRVFPGNPFKIGVVVQSYGMEGETIRVRLGSGDDDDSDEVITEDEKSVQLSEDGRPLNVEFEVGQSEEGRRRYYVEIDPPRGDLDLSDNQRSIVVQSLVRKLKVLLIAGGPTRDYQFLRNQLYRDENVELDVWLQMALPGADQEADRLRFEFPESEKELESFDCIVAFDPDWRQLSDRQARWLERWVSEKAGGLLVIAGPVFTPEWTRRPRGEEAMDLIRSLYPVSFFSQGSAALKLGRFGGEDPFSLEFTRAGRSARHLWLGDQAARSIANWENFSGVYGYYAVNEAKAGANVLARFSDPQTAIEGDLPIYLASHYYGAGRVFFQASGEVWRLRRVDVSYFQDYYENLIRWVSEGRLLRDSNRGLLLLDRDRCWVGDQVAIQAILRDASDQPLMQPEIMTKLRVPDGTSRTVELVNLQNAARPGVYTGQFVAAREGSYEVSLPLPDSREGKVLKSSVEARIPDLEKVRPERNDVLLSDLAERTGGRYYYDVTAAAEATWHPPPDDEIGPKPEVAVELTGRGGLADMIDVVDQESFLPGSPDEIFTQKFSRWLLLWLVLVFCTEWTLRRLHRLA